MIISRTPFRISFFGGGTDYPAWFKDHGGAFLSVAINRYCYVMARQLPPFFDVRGRISWSKIENVHEIDDIENPVVRETLRFLEMQPSLDIHYHGDLPARAGLASSSAFCVGLLNALHALRGEFAGKMQLANEAIRIEQDFIRDTVGVQDQIATAHGGLNICTIEKTGEVFVRPVVIGPERSRELESHMMLFFTGVARSASEIAETKVSKFGSRLTEMKRIRELVDEAHRALCEKDDISHFGELLHETWLMKRSLSDRVSTTQVDDAYAAALKAGAFGGKLLGAGGGGFLLIFAPPERHKRIMSALKSMLHVPIRFDYQGSQVIYQDPFQ